MILLIKDRVSFLYYFHTLQLYIQIYMYQNCFNKRNDVCDIWDIVCEENQGKFFSS